VCEVTPGTLVVTSSPLVMHSLDTQRRGALGGEVKADVYEVFVHHPKPLLLEPSLGIEQLGVFTENVRVVVDDPRTDAEKRLKGHQNKSLSIMSKWDEHRYHLFVSAEVLLTAA